ncbi:MAG: DUF488 family protein, partial [Paramuribaculum sp.]|nr:DUF488 family protein [Paramuribaculum sp.]
RGLSHETFHFDLWDKDIAPSPQLREWFHHNPDETCAEFEQIDRKELINSPALNAFKAIVDNKPKVTLLYSSHDTVHNNAQVLRDLL